MPQLDFSFYLSQICWLLVSFGVFFCISKFFILPKLEGIFAQRENLINGNLNYAEKMLLEAEKITSEYNAKLAQNISINQEKIDNLSRELEEKSKNKIDDLKKILSLKKNQYIANAREEIFHFDKTIANDIAVAVQNFLKNTLDIELKIENVEEEVFKKLNNSSFII